MLPTLSYPFKQQAVPVLHSTQQFSAYASPPFTINILSSLGDVFETGPGGLPSIQNTLAYASFPLTASSAPLAVSLADLPTSEAAD